MLEGRPTKATPTSATSCQEVPAPSATVVSTTVQDPLRWPACQPAPVVPRIMGNCLGTDSGPKGVTDGAKPPGTAPADPYLPINSTVSAPPVQSQGQQEEQEEQEQQGPATELPLEALAKATQEFSEVCLLGRGPTAMVYLGPTLPSLATRRPQMVVRKLNSTSKVVDDFKTQVEDMQRLRHRDIARLLGYCVNRSMPRHMLLAVEYAPLGCLRDLLHGKKRDSPPTQPLLWPQRLSILLGAARGLEFVHAQGAMHNRMCSANVLVFEGCVGKLDCCNMQPLEEDSFAPASVYGEFSWQAPEVLQFAQTSEISTKSDVYSFGIVLLEAVTGKRTIFQTLEGKQQQTLKNWVSNHLSKDPEAFGAIIDPVLLGSMNPLTPVHNLCKLAIRCVNHEADQRPDMNHVVTTLQTMQERLDSR